MKLLGRLLDSWSAIVRTTWEVFALFCGAGVVTIWLHYHKGEFAGTVISDHYYDLACGIVLLFVASFVTAILVHYKRWRASRWPGGGGRRGRN